MNNKLKREADQNYYNEKFSEFSTNMGRTWEVIGTKKHLGKIFQNLSNKTVILLQGHLK